MQNQFFENPRIYYKDCYDVIEYNKVGESMKILEILKRLFNNIFKKSNNNSSSNSVANKVKNRDGHVSIQQSNITQNSHQNIGKKND